MKTIIYQYWDGNLTPGNEAGMKAMQKYAKQIGSDYLFELNPRFVTNLGSYSPHYGAFKPIYDDRFKDYDYVLFADTDVIPVDGLTENIFGQFISEPDIELGICEEWNQPEMRVKYPGMIDNTNDEKWCAIIEKNFGAKMPRTEKGLPRVFNSGVVVYSKNGINKARENFVPFSRYVNLIRSYGMPDFYTCDQPYLHAMLEVGNFKWKIMDYKWNSSVHFTQGTHGDNRPVTDLRDNPNFVHIQLRGADHFDADTTYRIANLPVSEWNFR